MRDRRRPGTLAIVWLHNLVTKALFTAAIAAEIVGRGQLNLTPVRTVSR
jgi:hypothetical protein